jgi:hypothetical protein
MQPDDASVPLFRGDAETDMNRPLALAKRKIRWGAIALPRKLAKIIATEDNREIFHLGFGGEEHSVCEPTDGQYYI